MALDTAAKRAAAAHVKRMGKGVTPGALATDLGVAAAGWSYWPEETPPPTGGPPPLAAVLGQLSPAPSSLGSLG